MRPKTISASSLNVADKCLARYKAENIEFTPNPAPKTAANVGTSVHWGLERYVRDVYIDKSVKPSLDLLLQYYTEGYLETFRTAEHNTPEYEDGKELIERWFNRTDLSDVRVLSVETKYRMPVPSSIGDVPLTYIWDRCDLLEEGGKRIIRVVDYKTIREQLSPDKLRSMLQARIYDLAARTRFKDDNIDEFQVVFDLLRHESVGVIFSREEAVATWEGVKGRLERILAASDTAPPETLNSECAYCVRKLQCRALRKNIAGGGVFSKDIDEIASMRQQIEFQSKGLASALGELDERLIAHAKENQTLLFDTNDGSLRVTVSARKTRTVDTRAAAEAIGADLVAAHGRLGVGEVDKMISSGKLTDEQVEKLRDAMSFSISAESVKVTSVT